MASLFAKLPAIREVEVNLDVLEGILHVGDKSYTLEGDVRDVMDAILAEVTEKKKIIKRMYLDVFFFAKMILGDKNYPMHYHIRNPSPPFHNEVINNLYYLKPGKKIAIVAPRGHAKSTLVSLIYPLHRILFAEERFILLISESEMQSKYLLEALGDEVEYNEKLHFFFGNRVGDVWGKEEKEIITELNKK